jgi:hypothetical protein
MPMPLNANPYMPLAQMHAFANAMHRFTSQSPKNKNIQKPKKQTMAMARPLSPCD